MEIKWNNVLAMILLVLAITLLVSTPQELTPFLELLRQAGPGYSPDEQMVGVSAYMILAVLIVAIVKVMS